MQEETTIQSIEMYLKGERAKKKARIWLTIILVPIAASILVIAMWRDRYASAS